MLQPFLWQLESVGDIWLLNIPVGQRQNLPLSDIRVLCVDQIYIASPNICPLLQLNQKFEEFNEVFSFKDAKFDDVPIS